MGANTAGIYGAQIFRADDRPLYRRGFSINIAILAVAIGLAAVRFFDDLRRRRKQKGLNELSEEASNEAGDVIGAEALSRYREDPKA
jgi:hypothetical protein